LFVKFACDVSEIYEVCGGLNFVLLFVLCITVLTLFDANVVLQMQEDMVCGLFVKFACDVSEVYEVCEVCELFEVCFDGLLSYLSVCCCFGGWFDESAGIQPTQR